MKSASRHCFANAPPFPSKIAVYRVATLPENLENLEKSGNLKVVGEKSGKIGKIREKSGKMNYYNNSVAAIIVQTEICNSQLIF